MVSSKEAIEKISRQGSYRNSREISIAGIPFSMRDILRTAPLIAGLNVYLIGATGEGKTELANDLAGLFGESFCYMEGRPDFEPSELLKELNLGRLKTDASLTDQDLISLTENVRKALYYVDELNRAPPIVMNYFFNFFDGKLVHKGKILRLGKNGYSVGYASGNIGNGAYVGISDIDRALKDRMHLIVKLDDPQFCTTEEDDTAIFQAKKDPRASNPTSDGDCLEEILDLNQAFRERPLPLILPVMGSYFHKGLDYVEGTARHSKKAIAQNWPNGQGIRQDTDESKIMPLSKRAILATMGLSQALEMIAEARGHNVSERSLDFFLDALQFTVPFSGVLADTYVNQECSGDAYAAFNGVMASIRRELNEKQEAIEVATAYAQFGEQESTLLDKINPLGKEGRWLPVRRAIESLARNPSEDPTTLEVIQKEYKKSDVTS